MVLSLLALAATFSASDFPCMQSEPSSSFYLDDTAPRCAKGPLSASMPSSKRVPFVRATTISHNVSTQHMRIVSSFDVLIGRILICELTTRLELNRTSRRLSISCRVACCLILIVWAWYRADAFIDSSTSPFPSHLPKPAQSSRSHLDSRYPRPSSNTPSLPGLPILQAQRSCRLLSATTTTSPTPSPPLGRQKCLTMPTLTRRRSRPRMA
jgi:hypothetical protein